MGATGNADRAQYFDGSSWHTELFPETAAAHQWVQRIHARDELVMFSSERVLLYAEGQWQEFNPTNSPLSDGTIQALLGLDVHNQLWISHSQPWSLDIYETGLISSSVQPESSLRAVEMRVSAMAVERAGLKIPCRRASTSAELRITDVDGRLVSTTSHNLQSGYNYLEVNVSRLSPGIYFMLLETNQERFYGRMVKEYAEIPRFSTKKGGGLI